MEWLQGQLQDQGLRAEAGSTPKIEQSGNLSNKLISQTRQTSDSVQEWLSSLPAKPRNTPLNGLIGGFVATVPMTLAMFLMSRLLPKRERQWLPPKAITKRIAQDKGPFKGLDEPERTWLTGIMHFGFGSAAGALYAPLAKKLPVPVPIRGLTFGLLIWAISYIGWLPALDIFPPPDEQPARRNVMLIVAHLIWGVGTAWVTEGLDSQS